jgi:hypothetical protein
MQKLISHLTNKYPEIRFQTGDTFSWSPSRKIISYVDSDTLDQGMLLHELSHALLGHTSYNRDVELLRLEQEAWEHAKQLAKDFDIEIAESDIDTHLDTYRDWLHQRSLCPNCDTLGYQIKKSLYTCPVCSQEWRVNDAKTCQLRRYKVA